MSVDDICIEANELSSPFLISKIKIYQCGYHSGICHIEPKNYRACHYYQAIKNKDDLIHEFNIPRADIPKRQG